MWKQQIGAAALWALFGCGAALAGPLDDQRGHVVAGALPTSGLATAQLEDLRRLERDYVLASASFEPAKRRAALAEIERLRRAAGSLDPLGFYIGVARVAAIADNGHDTAFRGRRAWQPSVRLPLRPIWFADALVVARAAPEHRDIVGARILAIDAVPPKQLMARLRPLQGGTDGYRRWALTSALVSPELLHAIGVAREPKAVTLRLRLRDGRRVERKVDGVAAGALPAGARQQAFWYPAALPGESERGWSTAAPADRVPLYLEAPDQWFRMKELPELDALYVQFRSNMDEGEQRIAPFVAAVAERLRARPPRHLVLDLRFDTGGDNTQNRELMREIAARVPGRIYVLVGNYTFSAGIASAAALKHDGGGRVTIVGEPMGDRLRWWSEQKDMVCLPNSDICVAPQSGLWDLERGCAADANCYGDRFDINVATLAPDIRAPLTSRDWQAGRDPAMEAIAADLGPLTQ